MRVAIISDVHSNLEALRAVLADADDRRVDGLWCLGDIVGYGPEPSECLAIVRERASLCLSGNHDLGTVGALSLEEFNAYAAAANAWTGELLSDAERQWLGGLPTKLVSGDVTLAHGTPRDPVWEYLLSVPVAMATFEYFSTRLCFVGHSHVPVVTTEPEEGERCVLYEFPKEPLELGDKRLIANPGSVGQPRDRDPRSSYLIYDRDADILEHRRVSYDIEATQGRMREAGLPGYLIDRLSHGT